MNETFYCGNRQAWAVVKIVAGSDVCSLDDFDFPARFHNEFLVFEIATVIGFILLLAIIIIGLFMGVYHHSFIKGFVSADGDSLLTRHPIGYWSDNLAEGVPFGNTLRRFLGTNQ